MFINLLTLSIQSLSPASNDQARLRRFNSETRMQNIKLSLILLNINFTPAVFLNDRLLKFEELDNLEEIISKDK